MQGARIPPYYMMLKQKMIDQCQQMGMDPFKVQDFLDEKGLAEMNVNVILDQLHNPGYINPLRRVQYAMPQQPQMRQFPAQG